MAEADDPLLVPEGGPQRLAEGDWEGAARALETEISQAQGPSQRGQLLPRFGELPEKQRSCGIRVIGQAQPEVLCRWLRFEPLGETRLSHEVLPALTSTLKELGALYTAHRAIRADNLFLCGAEGREIVLGECVSALPGLFQPVTCETIESGQALPSARGAGRRRRRRRACPG